MPDPANSVSVSSGSTAVTGTLTNFVATEGDLFLAGGFLQEIATRNSAIGMTLKNPWLGPSVSGSVNWGILSLGPYWRSAITTNRRMSDLLAKWENVSPFKFDESGTLANRSAYNNQPKGFVYVATDQTPLQIFVKLANTNNSSDWSRPVYLGSSQIEYVSALAQEAASRNDGDAALRGRLETVEGSVLDLRANAFDPVGLSPTPPSVDLIATAPDSIPASWFTRGLAALSTDPLGLLRSSTPNGPRIEYHPTTGLPLGLVIEEPRTYSIRKNDMAGAVAGSPGTLPLPAGAGRTNATINVLGTGFLGDAPYIDLEFVFTAAGGSVTLRWNGTVTTVVPAAESSTWAYVIDAALLSGSMSDLSVAEISVSARNASGAAIAGGITTASLLGLTAELKPYSVVGTMVAGTVYVAEGISLTARVATTIRLRLMLPQMEQGLFPTRRVITRGTVLTRPADLLVIPLTAGRVNPSGNTVRVAAFTPSILPTGFATLFCLDAGASTERLIARVSSVGAVSVTMVAGGITVANLNLGSVSLGAEARVVVDYQPGLVRASLNGGAVVSAAPATLMSTPISLRGGHDVGPTRFLNSQMGRLSLIPRPQASASIIQGMAA